MKFLLAEYAWIKSEKKSLNLFEDNENLFRVSECFGNSYFTALVVNEAHTDVMHSGVEATLSKTRSRYWIIRGRQTIKCIIKKSITCLRKTYVARSPDLPTYRMISMHGCQSTGTAFAGPLFVKDNYSKRSEMNKCCIRLFTWATSRAVHWGLTPDMMTSAFIRSVKRFISRRGTPSSLLASDNFK